MIIHNVDFCKNELCFISITLDNKTTYTLFTIHGNSKYQDKPQIFHYMYLLKAKDPMNNVLCLTHL